MNFEHPPSRFSIPISSPDVSCCHADPQSHEYFNRPLDFFRLFFCHDILSTANIQDVLMKWKIHCRILTTFDLPFSLYVAFFEGAKRLWIRNPPELDEDECTYWIRIEWHGRKFIGESRILLLNYFVLQHSWAPIRFSVRSLWNVEKRKRRGSSENLHVMIWKAIERSRQCFLFPLDSNTRN